MILTETQEIVAKDRHRFRVLCSGRRWGKTTLAILEMVAKAVFNNDARVCYIAPTYQQARDIAWNELKKICRPIAKNINEARLEITIATKNGGTSMICLRGWESVETLRGQRFDFVVIDEIASMRNFWLNWQEVIRPTLTDRKGEVLFVSTPKGFNHFYDLYNFQDEDYKSFHFTTYDNPHLPVEEIDKAKKELPEDRFAQEYMADFRKQQGLVYKEFSRDRHVFETLPDRTWSEYIAGIDFGFTNPTAVIHIKRDGDDNYFVTEEWYKTSRTEEQIAEYVQSCHFNRVYPDSEAPSAIEVLNRRGVAVVEVVKNKDSVQNGINRVRQLLKMNKLSISKSCVNLISELETYSYPEKKSDSNEYENPIKEHDHACFIAGTIVNGMRIEDIGTQTGVEKVYSYDIAGEVLTATKNHPVLTHRGMVDIDALRYNDVIWKGKSLFTKVSGGIDTQAVKNGLKGITLAVLKRIYEAKDRDYTDLFGKKQMEKSPLDSMFITLMAIPQITLWTIYSLWTAANTLVFIGLKKSESGLEKISNALSEWLPSGQRLQLVSPLGQKWGKETLNTSPGILLRNDVIYVEKSISAKSQMEDSATLTTDKKHYVGLAPVYNLKTKSGMFLANNILVSNCDALRYAITTSVNTNEEGIDGRLRRMTENIFKEEVEATR